MLDARSVAAALGGAVIGRNRVAAPGPGHGAKDRSLVVKLDDRAPGGYICHSFAGDDWRDCREHVRAQLGLPPWQPGDEQDRRIPGRCVARYDRSAVEAQAKQTPRWTDDDLLRINRGRTIWHEAGDPRGTIGETYLRRFRKLSPPEGVLGDVLRFHLRCPWRCEDTGATIPVPALIAAFRQIEDDHVTGIHRIALNEDGSKRDRRMLGVVQHAAVKLAAPRDGTLVIAEGIETALAAMQLGLGPAWALGSVGAIAFFPVVRGVRRLVICGESGTASAEAIRLCAPRWCAAGVHVETAMPSDGLSDLNDELIARAS